MLHAQTSLSIHDSVDYGKDFKEQLDALTDKHLVVRNQIRPDFEPNNSALPLNRIRIFDGEDNSFPFEV